MYCAIFVAIVWLVIDAFLLIYMLASDAYSILLLLTLEIAKSFNKVDKTILLNELKAVLDKGELCLIQIMLARELTIYGGE